MGRKSAVNSIAAKIARASGPDLIYDVPRGLEALTEREVYAWDDYIQAKDTWKACDLRTLRRLVKIESELIEKRQIAAEMEPNDPFHKEVRDIQKLLHSEVRILGLIVPQNMIGSAKNTGKVAKQGGKSSSVSLVK